jgi:GT2 family glycosyltransferase
MDNITYINSDCLERPKSDLNYKEVRQNLSNENEDVTIIVQAFGRLERTRNCVESIIKYTNLDYELMLLDNGTATNEITDYFKSVDYKKKNIVKFTKNITGVYALDKVFRIINSKYIIMIPNDIIVTHNWLDNLIACAQSDESIGMVLPTSTNISNYQFENMGGFNSIDEMQEKAAAFNVSDPLKWEERIRLIPTATLYRREIFDVVGLYDAGFMHDFGDDDFTFRVRRAGYKLMLCKDTFVHHDHDQTKLPQERIEIMNKSREFFKEKYMGIDAWTDTGNSIAFTFESVEYSNNDDKKILALDVKCGNPVFEAKNFLRRNNMSVSKICTYTSDPKYIVDLQSISDECICGNIENTIKDEEEKFDLIIIGNPINYYNNPIELLKNIIKKRSKESYIIFPIKNTNDIRSLLSILNIQTENDELYPRKMNYKDVLNKIADFGINNAEVTYTIHNIDEQTKSGVANLVISMDVRGDKNEIMQNLLIEDYWVTIK